MYSTVITPNTCTQQVCPIHVHIDENWVCILSTCSDQCFESDDPRGTPERETTTAKETMSTAKETQSMAEKQQNTVITIERQWTMLLNSRRQTTASTDERGVHTWSPNAYRKTRSDDWGKMSSSTANLTNMNLRYM